MTEKEAIKLGYSYTGMSAPAWEPERWEEYKKKAAMLKKTYTGVDYKCVNENGGWKSIYGNNLFHKVQYFIPEQTLNNINNMPKRIEKVRADAEKKVAELLEEQQEMQKEYDYLMSIRKEGK